jgi:hypothetical protein
VRDNPYLRRASGIGVSGRLAERKLAKRFGAVLRPNSGALVSAKGDMTLGRFLIEAKSTVSQQLAVKLDWLAKITAEASAMGQVPAVTVSFTTSDGRPVHNGVWVLVPGAVFARLVAARED